jgi:DNA polymerase-1
MPGDDSSEKADGALTSSWHSMRRALREHGPTHFACCFDHGGKTWRHELYPDYKAHRDPMPECLRQQLPGYIEEFRATGLTALSVPGVEADDTIATLALRAAARGFRVIVMTTDKDMCWLLAHGIKIYDHFGKIWRDAAWVSKRFYGITPAQVPDYLALMGDDSDGIPGVPDIGEKTAAKLLIKHGNLDAVLAAAARDGGLRGRGVASLREHAPLAVLSLKLATLKTDVPLGSLAPRDLRLPQELRYDATVSGPGTATVAGPEPATPAPALPAAAPAAHSEDQQPDVSTQLVSSPKPSRVYARRKP